MIKKNKRFIIVIEAAEEGGYHAWCPVLSGCHSQGETLEEAKQNLKEAMLCHLGSFRRDGSGIPQTREEFVGTLEVSI